jgi:hypothetical protein
VLVVQHHEPAYWTQKCVDHFNRLYAESAARPKIMALAIHPYVTGQPSRIAYLEAVYDYIASKPGVVHLTGERILAWFDH